MGFLEELILSGAIGKPSPLIVLVVLAVDDELGLAYESMDSSNW